MSQKKLTMKIRMNKTFEIIEAATGRLTRILDEGFFPTQEMYRRYCYLIEQLADLNQECEETIEKKTANYE